MDFCHVPLKGECILSGNSDLKRKSGDPRVGLVVLQKRILLSLWVCTSD